MAKTIKMIWCEGISRGLGREWWCAVLVDPDKKQILGAAYHSAVDGSYKAHDRRNQEIGKFKTNSKAKKAVEENLLKASSK